MTSPDAVFDAIGEKVDAARRLLDDGKPDKAVKPLEQALRMIEDPSAHDGISVERKDEVASLLLTALAKCGRSESRVEAAVRCYRAGARSRTAITVVAAHRALDEKRTDPEALESYLDAIELRVEVDATLRERLLQILAHALHVDLDTPEASVRAILPSLERLRRLRPTMSFPRFYLGRWHYRQREWAAAVAEFTGITGHLSQSPKLLNLLGRAQEKLGRLADASATYAQSLTADGTQAGVHFRRGRVLLALFRAQVLES